MPELPEVETICNRLKLLVQGLFIVRVDVYCGQLRQKIEKDFVLKLEGKKISKIHRRAKYIIVDLVKDDSFFIHLGMTGVLKYKDYDYKLIKHDHVVFYLNNNHKLIYNDVRRFGSMNFIDSYEDFIANFGYEPLDDILNEGTLSKITKCSQSSIKILLMNNNNIVGIGNIYASEILFDSRIIPTKRASILNNSELSKLVNSIKKILLNAIRAGGTTIKDYKSLDDDTGSFQGHLMVYNQKLCKICHNKINKITQAGRSTFFCIKCQS